MANEIQASVLHGAKDLRTETRTLPPPADDELQIAIGSTGLCGSDLHYYHHFRNGDILVREPLSLGHESSGVVVAVGSHATSTFNVGDKVALEVGLPCSKATCAYCSSGRYNLCQSMRFRSSGKSFPHLQGTLQQRINHPADWCYKLPDPLGLDDGALLEPLSVALHAYKRGGSDVQGKSVLVFGAGAVGLLCAAVATLKGARRVTIADIDAGRLEFAVRNGFASASYEVPRSRPEGIDAQLEVAKEVAVAAAKSGATENDRDDAEHVDVVFECTGVPACVQAGIFAARAGGKLLLVGMGHAIQTLPLAAAALREVDIVGVFRYAGTYRDAIELLSEARRSGKVDLGSLVTHRYQGFGKVKDAFEMAGKTKDEEGRLVIKVVIDLLEAQKVVSSDKGSI